jgi:hypothetical protein
VKERSGDRSPAAPRTSKQREQWDRTSVSLSKHLHKVSPVPRIPLAEKKGKQSAQLVSHKADDVKRNETARNKEDC